MSFKEHRERLYQTLAENTLVIAYAGIPVHTNEDEYYDFIVNSQYFYLTGVERENTAFLAYKTAEKTREILFIEEPDPKSERWTGKMSTKEEVRTISGIEDVRYTDGLEGAISGFMGYYRVEQAYFDLFRCGMNDLPDYNMVMAEKFSRAYPHVALKDLHAACTPLREQKDAQEVESIRKALDITRRGLEYVMKNLKPGMMEYQVQADFEYTCRRLGAKRQAFPTIAGSGLNRCMMHYETNHCEVQDGSLILLDLGVKYENYCCDITRTYPAGGKFSPRQREIYELVLKANGAVAAAAKPGVTTKDLNEVARRVLGEGLVAMGLIKDASEVDKYYMHSVSHPIGIDVHDISLAGDVLQPGWVISNEPGLYIDEEAIGIRIEDDLLITEDGCEVLSKDIIKDPDEIEAFMA
ncbi:MAG: aminopeptidase P N-terminal domain-containing protein [Oscillospiraceae bacterium]|nr:aminopeptidase P N-terminal domain-containing protein [Oscillospiraceae bacterium]